MMPVDFDLALPPGGLVFLPTLSTDKKIADSPSGTFLNRVEPSNWKVLLAEISRARSHIERMIQKYLVRVQYLHT
jgi:hypothetical protein